MMRCIILFAKAPVAGEVKTRLSPSLTPDEAATVQEAFIMDTLATLQAIKKADLFIACHPSIEHPFYGKVKRRFSLSLINQGEGSLGDRMSRVIGDMKTRNYDEIVVLGSDSPSIPADFIYDAFRRLERHKLVIGPSIDGGYYLIGFSGENPDIFEGISWGTDKVFRQTVEKMKGSQADYSVLPYWYDVDTIKDLRFLKIHLGSLDKDVCMETRKVFRDIRRQPGDPVIRRIKESLEE